MGREWWGWIGVCVRGGQSPPPWSRRKVWRSIRALIISMERVGWIGAWVGAWVWEDPPHFVTPPKVTITVAH